MAMAAAYHVRNCDRKDPNTFSWTRRTEIPCPTCGEASPPWAYDWKEKAGFGRLFLQIEEVFPGEAAPTRGLTDLLERCTGCAWRYFYIQDD